MSKAKLQENNTEIQAILETVAGLPDAFIFPELSNPAVAENIQSGYQTVNEAGEVVTGSYVPPKFNLEMVLETLVTSESNQWTDTSSTWLTPYNNNSYWLEIEATDGQIFLLPIPSVYRSNSTVAIKLYITSSIYVNVYRNGNSFFITASSGSIKTYVYAVRVVM